MGWRDRWRELSPFRRFAAAVMIAAGIASLIAVALPEHSLWHRLSELGMAIGMLLFAASLLLDHRAQRRAETE